MDRNQIIGFGLIFMLLIGYTYLTKPSPEEVKAMKARQDSIERVQQMDTTQQLVEGALDSNEVVVALDDSAAMAKNARVYGAFAPSSVGTDEIVTLANDVLEIHFSTKGGQIKEVWLKEFKKFEKQADNTFIKVPLKLLEDRKDRLEYIIPVANTAKGTVRSSDLYYDATLEGKTLRLRANAGEGRYLEQVYTLEADDSYFIDVDINLVGLNQVIPDNATSIELRWDNHLDKLEKNAQYERNQYSGIHYRRVDKKPKTMRNNEKAIAEPVQWVSSAQQFFNTTIIPDAPFQSVDMAAVAMDDDNEDLKRNSLKTALAYQHNPTEQLGMRFYIGPNDFGKLRSAGMRLEDIIEFGWGIFGTINRWIIRPIFNFLHGFIGSAGIVILLLTLVVKLALYPLTYGMLRSQAKMAALKPQLEKIKEKTGDDQQAYSVEQMNLYRETGVNPLGGCFPMVLQMPIWFALYRFFPAFIDFRHEGFLWADDLSSYDSIWTFGDVPLLSMLNFDHISLFTILWALTTLLYTYYNTKHMTMPNPAMKYVQYFMPIMFIFFFNNFASGLTSYLLFSNVINITQTLVTKNFLIDQKKLEAQLEANKKKPKKQSKFQAKLQEAMQQQQELQKQRANEQSRKTVEDRKKRNNK